MERPETENRKISEVEIVEAKIEDGPGVINVCESLLIKPDELISEDKIVRGFLIKPISVDEYKELIEHSKEVVFLVAKESGQVTGYSLAYDLKYWLELHPDWLDKLEMLEGVPKPDPAVTMYYRHAASLPAGRGAVSLSRRLVAYCRERGYKKIVGEVLEEPFPNQRSLDFHNALKYEKIAEIPDNFGNQELRWALLSKDLT